MSDLLIRYAVTDFVFDDLRDSVARHDAVNQRVIPRTIVIETARDRFTKESEKASREKQIVRVDYTARPSSFDEATTQVQDRRVQIGTSGPAPVVITSTQLHNAQHLHKPGEQPPTKPPPGGHGHK